MKNVQIVTNASSLTIDVTPSISHQLGASITSSPLEDGSSVADHVTLENKKISLDCMVTQYPIRLTTQDYDAEGKLSSPPTENRVTRAYNFLTDLWQNKLPFTLIAGLETYNNTVLTNLTFDESNMTNTTALKFNASFEQVFIAVTKTEKTEGQADSQTQIRGSKSVNRGKQETKTVTNEPNPNRSKTGQKLTKSRKVSS